MTPEGAAPGPRPGGPRTCSRWRVRSSRPRGPGGDAGFAWRRGLPETDDAAWSGTSTSAWSPAAGCAWTTCPGRSPARGPHGRIATVTIARTPFPDLPTALVTEPRRRRARPAQGVRRRGGRARRGPAGRRRHHRGHRPRRQRGLGRPRGARRRDRAAPRSPSLVLRFVAGDDLRVERRVRDGEQVARGDVVLSVHGPVGLLLTAERTALNYLGHLSGVATATATRVRALADTGAQVRDTCKTVPHLRALEKYAARAARREPPRLAVGPGPGRGQPRARRRRGGAGVRGGGAVTRRSRCRSR